MRPPLWLSALLVILASGCRAPGDSSVTASAAISAQPLPAQAAGMCSEHGVLEAVCTHCNPKLIPIFQSKGDWCVEHGFPESFCPVCHPERGGRPSGSVVQDEAPADGARVTFAAADVADQIGIETTRALPGDQATTVLAPATLVPDASKSARVGVRAPGLIRAFRADLGSRVVRGSPLAVIESASAAQDRARLQSARARMIAADATRRRETDLHEKGISAAKDVQAAEQALEEASAELQAAAAAAGMVGGATEDSGAYTLLAPISGVVTSRAFTVGSQVDQEDVLFEILDASSLWAEIDIPEAQSGRVAVGQRVVLEVDDLPDRTFEGILRYVAPVIDRNTRTIRARAEVDNRDGALRANSFARARIAVPSGGGTAMIPRSAVQEAKGVQLVFVRVAVDEFEARRVHVAPSDTDLVAVTTGLSAGELVVTTGSFLLKTETLKGSIGAGCCEVEPAK